MGGRVPGTAERMRAAVAATGSWTDPDGVGMPSREVHVCRPGTNQTFCGLSTNRSHLDRFAHVDWLDVEPATGRDADLVNVVCPRCAAVMGHKRDTEPWTHKRRRRP
jgi:hypothetical protein